MTTNQQIFDEKYKDIRSPDRSKDTEKPTFQYFNTLHNIQLSILETYAKQGISIDLGCGYGRHLVPLLKKNFNIHGLDFSQSLLDECRKECQKEYVHPIALHFADMQNMPFKNKSFDFAYSISTIYVIPDQKKVINEIYRILKPEGIAYIEFGNINSLNNFESQRVSTGIQCTHVSLDWLIKTLTEVGFHIFHTRFFQISPLYGSIVPRSLARVMATPYIRNGYECMLDEAIASSTFLQKYAFRLCMLISKSPRNTIQNLAVHTGNVKAWTSERRNEIRSNLVVKCMRDQLQNLCDLFREDPTDALTFYYLARIHIQTEAERQFVESLKQDIDRYIEKCS